VIVRLVPKRPAAASLRLQTKVRRFNVIACKKNAA
jgi:hypothetical protein